MPGRRTLPNARGVDVSTSRVESRDLGAENKAVTDTTFIRFRGPKALTDSRVYLATRLKGFGPHKANQ
jgi:hypothetical protein